ncbi:MAG: hypothetical protein KAS32_17735, partial [Candidatus Peribacteraceae bacterium]|nr:hypothetical protein [Candidatus Peribacteraceae bacterium]
VKFKECKTAGTLFTNCIVAGLDTNSLKECVFDKRNNTPQIDDKAIGVDNSVLKTIYDDDGGDDEDNYYEYMMGRGTYNPYGAYGEKSIYPYKPKNKGKPWAYRFYSAGIIQPKKTKV